MGSLEAHPLAGTEGVVILFWSPDSRYLGVSPAGQILKSDVSGGPPIVLATALVGLGGTWSREGLILLGSSYNLPLLRGVSAAGGEVKTVLSPDRARQESGLGWP